jgi:FkbM family methyltransferase
MSATETQYGFLASTENPAYQKFWKKMLAGRWEADTINFIQTYVDDKTTFFDIGAWIGPVSLLAGQQGARVIAVEPDPVAFSELTINCGLNNYAIELLNCAVATERGTLTLFSAANFGNSETSALLPGDNKIEVDAIVFTDLPAAGPKKVVKIDVEGFEYQLSQSLIDFCSDAIAVHLSLHPRNLAKRLPAWKRTIGLLERFWQVLPASAWEKFLIRVRVFRRIFLRRRIGNLTVILSRQ